MNTVETSDINWNAVTHVEYLKHLYQIKIHFIGGSSALVVSDCNHYYNRTKEVSDAMNRLRKSAVV